jgi:hypothetical protein
VDQVSQPERITGHFMSPDGKRMEASYLRYPHESGQWVYYKIPGSERKCECQAVLPRDVPHVWR